MAFDKEKTLESAQKYIDKEQYDKAVRELLKVVEVEPEDERTLLRLATCYESLSKFSDAGSTYYKIAQGYRAKGAYQKALAILKQAQKCTPDDDDVAMGMAELYSALGLPHEAISQLEKCLSRCDRETNRCVYVKILQMMVRVDSENVQTRTRYALALYDDGDADGAKRQYSLALAQLLSKERYVDYIQVSRDYLKIAPKDVDVLCELARIYAQMERYNEAIVLLSDLKTEEERTVDVREIAVECYKKLHRNQDAVRELKAIARQLEAAGERPDLVEDAWNRAQSLAPYDSEILAALSGEPPMLSDSALNIVSSGVEDAVAVPEITQAERELAMKFSRALEAYRGGRMDEAQFLCQQIIEVNEQNVSALQLLSQIFETSGDTISQAQIERKIAKAVVEEDRDEAVRHVLKAERCTPRAWENFNLLLVFGVEPSEYGLSAPEMSNHASSYSNPTIPARQMAAAPAPAPIPSPARIPAPPAGRPSVPPPIPRGIPAPPTGRPPIPPPSRAAAPVAPIGTFKAPAPVVPVASVAPVASAAPVVREPAENENSNKALYQVSEVSASSSANIGCDVAALSDAVTEELDDLFGSLCKPEKAPKAVASAESVSEAVQDPVVAPESFQNPPVETGLSGIRGAVPGASTVANTAVTGIRAAVPGASTIANTAVTGIRAAVPNNPFAPGSNNVVQMTPVAQNPVPAAGLSRTVAPVQARMGESGASVRSRAMTSVVPNDVVEEQPKQAGIPDSERQRVLDALQEIDFYASLMLVDDARKLLQGLIEEFGDVDIIHESKVKLDALG